MERAVGDRGRDPQSVRRRWRRRNEPSVESSSLAGEVVAAPWAFDTHLIMKSGITRWGGRAGRYAEFPGAVSRCFDPISQQHVQFAYAYEYEAWLQARCDQDTAAITLKTTPIAGEVDGRPCSAKATFVVTSRRTGVQRLHLVCKSIDKAKSRILALKRVARSMDAEVVITTLAQVRARVDVFWRMELLRQAGTIHEGEGIDLDMRIAAALQSGDTHRERLVADLNVSPQLLDARLFWMHCHALLRLDLSQDNYRVHGMQEALS